MNISGSGRIAAGEYNEKISISGSGKLSGNVRCAAFSASGYASGEGDLDCSEKASVSGSMSLAENLYAMELIVSGSLSVGGNCSVKDKIHISGSMGCGGSLKCAFLETSGSVNADEGIEAEEIRISGAVSTAGLMNAEIIDIKLGNKKSKVGSIGGSNIKIYDGDTLKSGFRMPLLTKLVGGGIGSGLQVDEAIEGDVIAIENVSAPLVVGRVVAIGSGCQIDLVQYSEEVEIDKNAKIGKCEKV